MCCSIPIVVLLAVLVGVSLVALLAALAEGWQLFALGVAVGLSAAHLVATARAIYAFLHKSYKYQDISPIALNLERNSSWINLGCVQYLYS